MTLEEQTQRFDRWLAAHAALLHHVANGFAAGADRDDLLQELLLALWRAVPRFRGGCKESTYLYRVAHNAALSWRRTQSNYRARLDRFEQRVQGDLRAATPANDGREPEALQHVYAAIRLLPPLERSLILLHLDSLTYAEIADIHGMTEAAVGSRLNRIKSKLIQQMKEIIHELR